MSTLTAGSLPADARAGAAATPRALSQTSVWEARLWIVAETMVVFAIGYCLMLYLYSGTGTVNGDYIGVPAHDSWYHIQMAALIPKLGLVEDFRWLQYSYFMNEGHDFVSHHYGFHVLLIPFVYAGKWITGDFATGGRWGICFFFGMIMALFNLLLIHANVRWRWLWLIAFFLLPNQFFHRHSYVRAIAPSLMFMFGIMLAMFKNRPIWTGILVGLYVHLYLGAVMFAPILVAVYCFAALLGPKENRQFLWKIALFGFVGWWVGVLSYPYRDGMFEFLKMQVFGTGLTPDIEVGREWRPYEGVWWFAQMAGSLLLVWAVSLLARMRFGRPLDGKETALLVLNFFFLFMTFKARRFIEYWPAFALLSAAFLFAPLSQRIADWWNRDWDDEDAWTSFARYLLLGVGVFAACFALVYAIRYGFFHANLGERDVQIRDILVDLVANGYLWVPLLVYVMFVFARSAVQSGMTKTQRAIALALTPVVAIAGAGVVASAAGPTLTGVRRAARCTYDVEAVKGALAYIQENSAEGEIIFTDDWDDFGLHFYHNWHNNYIVGLDPKFTHARRPDLWERFVKITRGQTPADVDVEVPHEDGTRTKEKIHIALTDIRDHFKAKWVLVDRNHRPLRKQLNRAKGFAELVYPCDENGNCDSNAQYVVYKILEGGAYSEPSAAEQLWTDGIVYLNDIDPKESVDESCLRAGRQIDGKRIRADGKVHLRGIAIANGCEVTYEIPDGFKSFEATLAAVAPADGAEIGFTIRFDDKVVTTKLIEPTSGWVEPLHLKLNGAKTITISVFSPGDTTTDGSFNLASARLLTRE